ncbi:MAG: rubredoxin [Actinomycetota bacterium]|nr:rubredoxin [Actinomycetota bacterium]
MAIWRCVACGAVQEGRCKPRQCSQCGSKRGFEKVEKKS